MSQSKIGLFEKLKKMTIYLGVMIGTFLIAGVILHTLNLNSFFIIPIIVLGCYLFIITMRRM